MCLHMPVCVFLTISPFTVVLPVFCCFSPSAPSFPRVLLPFFCIFFIKRYAFQTLLLHTMNILNSLLCSFLWFARIFQKYFHTEGGLILSVMASDQLEACLWAFLHCPSQLNSRAFAWLSTTITPTLVQSLGFGFILFTVILEMSISCLQAILKVKFCVILLFPNTILHYFWRKYWEMHNLVVFIFFSYLHMYYNPCCVLTSFWCP